MNELLTKIATEAQVEHCISHVRLQAFADLITQECANLCDRFQERDVGMQPAECAGAIRKMFGVEE